MDNPEAHPAFSTPATHIFEDDVAPSEPLPDHLRSPEQLHIRYEIDRTVAEIKRGQWKRIALQFPDNMLPDAPFVVERLNRQLHDPSKSDSEYIETKDDHYPDTLSRIGPRMNNSEHRKLFILADTSYGACCVDEIAAEHASADVIVHYGRACLSPTSRLPVIHVFTCQPLATNAVIESFKTIYPNREQSILLMADVTYAGHLESIDSVLKAQGYTCVFTTAVVRDPSSPLPNRTVPESVYRNPEKLREWQLFHISDPPDSLLLTLASRVSNIHVYPTTATGNGQAKVVPVDSTKIALRKRYALLTSVSTVPIFGILINTLSVRNYLHMVEHVKSCIRAAGKKSYTFVVGKINAAKVANFSEIGAWVAVGCWESSLIDSSNFWRPILAPFELELALASDDARVWTGEWKSDIQTILKDAERHANEPDAVRTPTQTESSTAEDEAENLDSEPESAPPEFDLRTGRYVSHSRPMQGQLQSSQHNGGDNSAQRDRSALMIRAKCDMVSIGSEASPGAEFLRSKRTWKGLGSDFEIAYDTSESNDSVAVEEGRSGLARGYLGAHLGTRT
ncbi:MAG: hypothetical protein L6R41_000037 [Letrouitia leprolyta]|nr:MAG: hypothetical protein L6R41_000037 [Letrouitia leprolyta]